MHEPEWAERLTISVGPDKADLIGRDDKVIQAAVDYVARLGGGTVQLLPGTFTLRNAIFLPSRLRLRGSGSDTVITKIASETASLDDDSDWYDQEITLPTGCGFRVGDGVVLRATNPHNGGPTVIKRTLVARSGNRFKLNDGLRENLWMSGKPTCESLFPLLTSEHTADVLIEDLTLDGNREQNANLDGNYAGCIFLQDCNRYTMRRVESATTTGMESVSRSATTWRSKNVTATTTADWGSIPVPGRNGRAWSAIAWNGMKSACSGAGG